MSIKMALLSFSEPGTKPLQHGNIPSSGIKGANEMGYVALIEQMFKAHGITGAWCDTMTGWGSLNQSWMEVTCFIDTNWNWCMPTCFSEAEKDRLFAWLHEGRVLMQVYYVNPEYVERDDLQVVDREIDPLVQAYRNNSLTLKDFTLLAGNIALKLMQEARREKYTAHH